MKYAVVSDIHANKQAWTAVLLDIRSLGADAIICLGDVVGYGPDPSEVLQSLYENVNHFCLGNHDAVICRKLDPSLFNEGARAIIAWTKEQLSQDAVKFLRSLPLTLDGDGFRCAHGDFSQPAAFHYIIEPEDAAASWFAVPDRLLFVGHSHRPGIFLLGASGIPRYAEPQDFVVEDGRRYLVNVGSVGQPRDGEARASYCLYDTEENSVRWRRIPFDIDAYRSAMERAGLPAESSYFLRHDPRLGARPLRDLINFTPASTPEQAVQDTVEVQELTVLRKRVSRWRGLFTALLVAAVAAAVAAGVLYWRHAHRALVISHPLGPTFALPPPPVDPNANLLDMPQEEYAAGVPIAGWDVGLGHRRRQSVHCATVDGANVFVLNSSSSRDEMWVSSPNVAAGPGMRFGLEALFKMDMAEEGEVAAYLVLTRRSGSKLVEDRRHIWKRPNPRSIRAGGWLMAKETTEKGLPEGAESIRVEIRGNFTGTVRVKAIALTRKE